MNANKEIIHRFYSAFQKLDHQGMNNCYSDDIIFNDPAFGVLQGDEARAMWEMLCKQATDFSLSFSNIELLDEEYATCNWIASYTFSRTGRKVVNHIKAHMRIEGGKITEHTDQFDLWKWSRQALGVPGWILGWTGYMRRKVNNTCRVALGKFMESRK